MEPNKKFANKRTKKKTNWLANSIKSSVLHYDGRLEVLDRPGTANSIGIGAQSTMGVKTFLPKNVCMKINKISKFYMIFA